jgi:hypothetical protein
VEHIVALEKRMLEYLERLNVPTLGDLDTVKINRKTYLPDVSTRSFDELSSQGLKTLVNVAPALAHHTVAIDRGLFLPGLLVLDGVSANSGKEGLDGERILDMHRLFVEVSTAHEAKLQLVSVDHEVPEEIIRNFGGGVVLTLTQSDRLIRASWPRTDNRSARWVLIWMGRRRRRPAPLRPAALSDRRLQWRGVESGMTRRAVPR